MSEKIKNVINNENVKGVCKKIFTKKNVKALIAIFVVLFVLKTGYSLMFEVNGVVRKVTTNSITVANFFNTRTINTGSYKIDTDKIVVGERVEISKNLSGQVLDIRAHGEKHDENDEHEKNMGEGNKHEGKGENHFRGRH